MNWGSDFKLDDDGDIVFEFGDLKIEDTFHLIAQDLKEEASIPFGSLPWDPEAGSKFFNMINSITFDPEDVIAELERLALKDPRVIASSVKAEETSENKFRLSFTPLGVTDEKSIYFDLDELLNGENNE